MLCLLHYLTGKQKLPKSGGVIFNAFTILFSSLEEQGLLTRAITYPEFWIFETREVVFKLK